MTFDSILKTRPCWFTYGADYEDIAVATMGRMARNLPGHPFPGWGTEADRRAVAERLIPALQKSSGLKNAFIAEMSDLTQEQRLRLLERKQITPCMAARQTGCHYLINKQQSLVAMVNEEEHLCVHASHAGFAIDSVLRKLRALEKGLAQELDFARNEADGFLTSIPTECGSGLQLYMVFHLPALVRTDMIDRLRRALEKMHYNCMPFFSDDGEEVGSLFVVFSSVLKHRELPLQIEHFDHICRAIYHRELRMRDKLMAENAPALQDSIRRAYAILSYATLLDFKEMVYYLSMVRLGLVLKIISPKCTVNNSTLIRLFDMYIQAAPSVMRTLHHELQNCLELKDFATTPGELRAQDISTLMSHFKLSSLYAIHE